MICVVEIKVNLAEHIKEVVVHGPFDTEDAAKEFFFGKGHVGHAYSGLEAAVRVNDSFIYLIEMNHPHVEIPF